MYNKNVVPVLLELGFIGRNTLIKNDINLKGIKALKEIVLQKHMTKELDMECLRKTSRVSDILSYDLKEAQELRLTKFM